MSSSMKRKQIIQQHLEHDQTVQVNELAQELSVSEMTIRRDLSELERIGVLKRTHGGAIKEVSRSYEPPFSLRRSRHLEQKQLIAREAVRFVTEGDTVVIDSGTSSIELARELLSFTHLTVITPSIHTAMLFTDHPTIEVLVSGGMLRTGEGSLVGDFTRHFFEQLYFDTFFLSAAAISSASGLTEYIQEDAAIKRMIASHAKKTIALITSDKFEKTAFARICPLQDIDVVISDREPAAQLSAALHSNHVEMRIPSQQGENL
jgi:DeoR family transcriptional regulator, fructose operon transcriptional repressor